MTNPPRASIWLDIPEDCQMRAEFTGEHDMQFTLGDHYQLGQTVLFERPALERFVKLAADVLAVPLPEDRKAALPVLTGPPD